MKRVPLSEQLEELESEWERRNREYPTLVAQGRMKRHRMELKQERLEASIKLLEWLDEHQETLREYILYATRICAPAQGGEWNEQVKDSAEDSSPQDGGGRLADTSGRLDPSAEGQTWPESKDVTE